MSDDDDEAEARRRRHAEYQREWRTRNRERVNAAKRKGYAADPEKHRAQAAEGYDRMKSRSPGKITATRRAWIERNKDRVAASRARAIAAAPERYRQYSRNHRLRKYGLTQEDYDRMFAEQGGVCAICRRPEPGGGNLHVDHDHPTNLVRGLLCRSCNQAIGFMDDDPRRLIRAARYLRDRGAYLFNEFHETEGRSKQ